MTENITYPHTRVVINAKMRAVKWGHKMPVVYKWWVKGVKDPKITQPTQEERNKNNRNIQSEIPLI